MVRRLKFGIAFLALATGLLHTPGYAQDKPREELVQLPSLSAYKLPKDEYLVLNVRMSSATATLIRNLRRVPSIHPQGTPTTLLFDKYLHKKSVAVENDAFYLETDWLTADETASIVSVAQHSAACACKLTNSGKVDPIRLVIARTEENYYALVDAWADTERKKREARALSSTIIGEFRCGYRKDSTEVMTLAISAAISRNLEPYLWNHNAIREGLHTFVSSFVTLDSYQYVNTNATTPLSTRQAGVPLLFETARDVLSRTQHDSLETILRSDLNSLTYERLSVAVALIHYLLETQQDHWENFLRSLSKESVENGKLREPEGLWNALSKAISSDFGMSVPELEKSLQKFAASHYLYTEEIATLIGIERECAESSFEGFVKVCVLKRQNKPVSEKGEKLYKEILGRMQKKLASAAEKL